MIEKRRQTVFDELKTIEDRMKRNFRSKDDDHEDHDTNENNDGNDDSLCEINEPNINESSLEDPAPEDVDASLSVHTENGETHGDNDDKTGNEDDRLDNNTIQNEVQDNYQETVHECKPNNEETVTSENIDGKDIDTNVQNTKADDV